MFPEMEKIINLDGLEGKQQLFFIHLLGIQEEYKNTNFIHYIKNHEFIFLDCIKAYNMPVVFSLLSIHAWMSKPWQEMKEGKRTVIVKFAPESVL